MLVKRGDPETSQQDEYHSSIKKKGILIEIYKSDEIELMRKLK